MAYGYKKSKHKDNSDSELLEKAKSDFQKCEDYYSELYKDGQEDQDFLYGINHWSAQDAAKRAKERRPSLTLNQCLPFAHQVINEIKQARPAVRVTPFDENADIETANVLQGLIRSVERQSNANDSYDMAAMNSVGSGYGWIRINTEYDNPMSFDQEPIIERVNNFQSIYIDPQSQKLDGSDMEYAFVFDDVDKDVFERDYPDAMTQGFDGATEWADDKTIRIAEYYYKEIEERTIYRVDIEGSIAVITKEEYNALEEEGLSIEILDERETGFEKIKWCKLTGLEILEQEDIIGSYIPIVPVYGEEVWLDGKRQSHSLIRQAKDAQRMYNYWKSCSTEMIALQPKAPWVGAVGSFASCPNKWADANNENYAFLEYDVVYDEASQRVEPPQRQMPIQGSPIMLQEASNARDDIRLGLGIFEAGLGQQGNEVSGVAIRNRQIKGENSTFHFIDNLSSSISRVGVILVDLIPKLYSDRKIARILGEDGEEENVPINQSFVTDDVTGKKRPVKQGEEAEGIYKLDVGKYDVVCDVGASYSSKRQEMADKLIELTKASPELMGVVGDKIMDALDMPEGREIADRIRAQMPPELLGDDPQAAKMQQAAKTIQEMQEQMANMEAALLDKQSKEDQDREFKVVELELDTKKTESDIAKTNADIAKIMSEIQGGGGDIQQITQHLMEVVANVNDLNQTVEIILDDVERDIVEDEQETGEPEIEPKQAEEISE